MKHHTISLVFVVSLLGAGVAVGVGVDTGSAQPTEEFNVTFGGSDTDVANSVVETSDGGFALAGTTESFGAGLTDAWLIKTDENGNEQFKKTFGGADFSSDRARSVVETSDGGLAMAGETESFGSGEDVDTLLIKTDANGNVEINKTFDNPLLSTDDRASSVVETSDGGFALAGQTEVGLGRGDSDARLIKTDANGNLEFSQTFGGSDLDSAESVVEMSDGGFALAGGTESFGSGQDDAWLIKTDENGNEQFNKTFGGAAFDRARSVVETSDGGLAMAGDTKSFGAGSGDAWLIKTDANGNVEINKTFGGTDFDSAESVVETSDGGLALAGEKTPTVGGRSDAWLIKTDANGNEQFNKTFGRIGLNDKANSVVETSGGGFALAGTTESFGAGGDDAWLIKTDANGNEQFNKTFGGAAFDRAESVVETSGGGFALAGTTESFGAGGDDAWLIKLSSPPDFEVSIDLTNSPVTEGETLGVTATVENTGAGSGTQTVSLTVGGTVRDTTEVTLPGSGSTTETLEWTTSDGDAGSYTAEVSTDNDTATRGVTVESEGGTGSSPVEGVSDALWNAVTQDDGNDGLSLADLGNAIQEYQKNPSDADVDGESIGLSDLGSLIQYYRTEVV